MNIFVVGTGRCGSMALAKLLSHCKEYTVGHESQTKVPFHKRNYPNNHIEVDNRLTWVASWMVWQDNMKVYRLVRDPVKVRASFLRRKGSPIIKAWKNGHHMNYKMSWEDAVDSYMTAEKMVNHAHPTIRIEDEQSIRDFLKEIGATVPEKAFDELKKNHNH